MNDAEGSKKTAAALVAEACEGSTGLRPAQRLRSSRKCSPIRTASSRSPSGSSAATAGHTISVTAASTTSLPSGEDVNVLVLDTEVYSNTGGQASKSTPHRRGREVRFERQAREEEGPRHDRGDLRLCVCPHQCAMGSDKAQLVKALKEAEAYHGPSPSSSATRPASTTAST